MMYAHHMRWTGGTSSKLRSTIGARATLDRLARSMADLVVITCLTGTYTRARDQARAWHRAQGESTFAKANRSISRH
jgi:hypothetical protein